MFPPSLHPFSPFGVLNYFDDWRPCFPYGTCGSLRQLPTTTTVAPSGAGFGSPLLFGSRESSTKPARPIQSYTPSLPCGRASKLKQPPPTKRAPPPAKHHRKQKPPPTSESRKLMEPKEFIRTPGRMQTICFLEETPMDAPLWPRRKDHPSVCQHFASNALWKYLGLKDELNSWQCYHKKPMLAKPRIAGNDTARNGCLQNPKPRKCSNLGLIKTS